MSMIVNEKTRQRPSETTDLGQAHMQNVAGLNMFYNTNPNLLT